jgi:protein-L-isoaspartate(D-aspartate) O-methyltransferase
MSELTAAEWRMKLISYLKEKEAFRTEPVEEAFANLPRENFLPAEVPLERVYSNDAIPVKFNEQGLATSSSSQPILMVDMLEVLDLQPGLRVLEIGAGVGYNAALLAQIVGETGAVTTVDLDAEMAEIARNNLQRLGEPYSNVKVVAQDGFLGYAENAPYDRIIVTVQQWELSPHWVEQLRIGGLLEVPLSLSARFWGGYIPVFRKDADGLLRTVAYSAGGFMPMRGSISHPLPQNIQPVKIDLPVAGVLPSNPPPIDPEQMKQAAIYLNVAHLSPEIIDLLKQELPVKAHGSFRFEIPNLPSEPTDWVNLTKEQREASLSLNALNSFLGIMSDDKLATVTIGVPHNSEEQFKPKPNVFIVDGVQHQTIGAAYLRILDDGQAVDVAIFRRSNLVQGWRFGASDEPDNAALQIAKEVWEKWHSLGQPHSSRLKAIAYPSDQPPPGIGLVAERQYFNFLLTEQE